MSAETWAQVVTAVTFMMGTVFCAAGGFVWQRRMSPWRTWPVESKVVRAAVLVLVGMVFLHIAMSRLYGDQVAAHVLDLNSPWTAGLRVLAMLSGLWLIVRIDQDE